MRAFTRARQERNQSGAAAVEFALISMVLVTLLFGILQYGWYFYSTQAATSGAREAARRLSVGDCQEPGEAQKYAKEQSNLSSLTLAYSPAIDTADVGEVLTVTVTADGGILGFVPVPNDGEITRTVSIRLEDKDPSDADVALGDATC